jgi:hypothetical protein
MVILIFVTNDITGAQLQNGGNKTTRSIQNAEVQKKTCGKYMHSSSNYTIWMTCGSNLSSDKNFPLSLHVQPDHWPAGGHAYPNLLVGDNLLCSSAQNKKVKSNNSEMINRI